MPGSKFGLPAERKYPMPDKAHARAAKSYAAKQERAGNLSEAAKEKIDRKAGKVLSAGHKNVVNPSTHHEKLRHV